MKTKSLFILVLWLNISQLTFSQTDSIIIDKRIAEFAELGELFANQAKMVDDKLEFTFTYKSKDAHPTGLIISKALTDNTLMVSSSYKFNSIIWSEGYSIHVIKFLIPKTATYIHFEKIGVFKSRYRENDRYLFDNAKGEEFVLKFGTKELPNYLSAIPKNKIYDISALFEKWNNNIYATTNKELEINSRETRKANHNKFALIIGNEKYSSIQKKLKRESDIEFAENDATRFKEYAEKLLGVPKDNILFQLNATYAEMQKYINQITAIIKNSGGDAHVYIYYAGHGYPDKKTYEPYLIPIDGDASNFDNCIKLNELYSRLGEYPSKKLIVFLDACFSGGGRNMGLISSRNVRLNPKKEKVPGKLVVFAACSEDQTSQSFAEKKHGIFTYFLLKRIADVKDDIYLSDLADYVSKQVSVKSIIINNTEQNPVILINQDNGLMWKQMKLIE